MALRQLSNDHIRSSPRLECVNTPVEAVCSVCVKCSRNGQPAPGSLLVVSFWPKKKPSDHPPEECHGCHRHSYHLYKKKHSVRRNSNNKIPSLLILFLFTPQRWISTISSSKPKIKIHNNYWNILERTKRKKKRIDRNRNVAYWHLDTFCRMADITNNILNKSINLNTPILDHISIKSF